MGYMVSGYRLVGPFGKKKDLRRKTKDWPLGFRAVEDPARLTANSAMLAFVFINYRGAEWILLRDCFKRTCRNHRTRVIFGTKFFPDLNAIHDHSDYICKYIYIFRYLQIFLLALLSESLNPKRQIKRTETK